MTVTVHVYIHSTYVHVHLSRARGREVPSSSRRSEEQRADGILKPRRTKTDKDGTPGPWEFEEDPSSAVRVRVSRAPGVGRSRGFKQTSMGEKEVSDRDPRWRDVRSEACAGPLNSLGPTDGARPWLRGRLSVRKENGGEGKGAVQHAARKREKAGARGERQNVPGTQPMEMSPP